MKRCISAIGLVVGIAFMTGCGGGGGSTQQGAPAANETTILPTPNPNTAATQQTLSDTAVATVEAGGTAVPPTTATAQP